MSRPHDGHRTFLPFGNPFRMIFPKGSYLLPKLDEILSCFEQRLAESLRKLKPEAMSDIWSLSWLGQAVNFLCETHNNIKILITDLELPVSDWEEKWIDIYLDTSIKLLDICIALSSELSQLDQGQILLQFVLHVLDLSSNYPSPEQLKKVQTNLSDWLQQTDSRNPKLDDCFAILQSLAGSLYSSNVKNSAKGKVLMRALYGVKVVTIFVCSVFTLALSGCSKSLITVVVPDKFLWAEAFSNLQGDVLKEITSHVSRENAVVLKELGAVEKCVKKLCALTEEEISEHMSSVCDNEITMFESSNDHEQKEIWQESVSELAGGAEKLSLLG